MQQSMLVKATAAVFGTVTGNSILAQLTAGGNMEAALCDAGRQVPALIVMVFIVRYFLDAQDKARQAQDGARQEYLAHLQLLQNQHQAKYDAVHQDYLEGRREQQENLKATLAAQEKMAGAVAALANAVQQFDRKQQH